MKCSKFSTTVAAIGAVAALAWVDRAHAVELTNNDPHEPGILSGVPTAAFPPPGVYFSNNLNYVSGSFNGGNGRANKPPFATANVAAWVEGASLFYSPPVHILGAQYGMAMLQPIVTG